MTGREVLVVSSDMLRTVLQEEQPAFTMAGIMMPMTEGIEICLCLRQWSEVPSVMLSWAAGESAVTGLDSNAEDYLTEPFGVAGLMTWMGEDTAAMPSEATGGESNRPQGSLN